MAQTNTGMREEQASSKSCKWWIMQQFIPALQLQINVFGSCSVTEGNYCQGLFFCGAQGSPFAVRGLGHRVLEDYKAVFDAVWKVGGCGGLQLYSWGKTQHVLE